jgi:predicted RNA-binding protein YlxR (DUF448 family)
MPPLFPAMGGSAAVKRGHVPERTCVGCGRKTAKASLVRFAAAPDGTVRLDRLGVLPGRGAYVCGPACMAQALRRDRLGRALRQRLPDHALDALRQWAEQGVNVGGNETEAK